MENIYFHCIIKEAEIFQFFKRTLHSIWQWVWGRFAGFSSSCLTCGCPMGSVIFGEPYAEKGGRTKVGKCRKQSIFPAAGTVLNEAANRVKQGGSANKKRKKLRRSTVYKAPSRLKKIKHSNSDADSDFEVEDKPKKSIKYNF